MMGPNYFCWQPICYVTYDVNSFAWHVKPRSYKDLQLVIDTIMKHKDTFDRYRSVEVWFGEKGGKVNSFLLAKDFMAIAGRHNVAVIGQFYCSRISTSTLFPFS